MKTVIGFASAFVLLAGAARADSPAVAAAQGATAQASQAAPPPAQVPAQTPPANPAPVPVVEHKEGPCALVAINKDLLSVEKEIRQSPAYGHAHGHYRLALHLIGHAMRQLNHGCHAYKRDLKKVAVKK